MISTQQWFHNNYPQEQRGEIKELDISHKGLTGSLIIVGGDFPQLEKLSCFGNKITNLTIINCLNLKKIDCYNNGLFNLNLNNLPNLEELSCSFNQLNNLDFLNNLNRRVLTRLRIDDNQLTDSLEKLSFVLDQFNNLKSISCTNTILARELEDYQEKDISGDVYYNYQSWKKDKWEKEWQKQGFSKEEINQWTNSGLKITELELALYLRKQDFSNYQIKIKDWLDFYFPQYERKNITRLDISDRGFEGELDCNDFTNLKELDISNSPRLIVELEKLPEILIEFNCQDTDYEKRLKEYGEPNLNNYLFLLKKRESVKKKKKWWIQTSRRK